MRRRKLPRRVVRSSAVRLRARRGIALFVAMFMVVAIGALALSAIYLSANATLISKTYEKEDDLKYAAEAALAMGKAELNYNPAALPSSSYVELLTSKTLTSADAQPVPGVSVNLYLGPTGSTTGQFGRFASLVAEARDNNNGTGFVRRLEVTQESFAKFAYWTNSEGATTIYFGGADQLWGPVWSNDSLHIDNTLATFHDEVATAKAISGVQYGTFLKGYQENQKPIPLPTLSTLSTLASLATPGSMNFTAPSTGNESTVRMRIEFVAVDLDGNGDSTEADEGLMRVYTASTGNEKWLRADWPGISQPSQMLNCGDFHRDSLGVPKFFPWAVHMHPTDPHNHALTLNTWFDTLLSKGTDGWTVASAHNHGDSVTVTSQFSKLLQAPVSPAPRCYLGGDPHLVAVARTTGLGYALKDIQRGGEDTTFTPTDQYGSWTQYSPTPNATIAAKRPADAKYLFPLFRGYNTNTKGVIYSSGTVGISGVVRSDITLYSPHTIVVLDDLRYANDPAAGQCVDIFGIIAGENVVVADNAINTPATVKTTSPAGYRSLDDTPDLYIHGVIMALGSFYVENYNSGPNRGSTCGTSINGRGCLYLTGGVIQNVRGAVALGSGTGFIKRYSYDQCAAQNPPPYFPTTGRFFDNRYYEIDPVRFNVSSLFRSLTAAP